jgi:hypothetical protein
MPVVEFMDGGDFSPGPPRSEKKVRPFLDAGCAKLGVSPSKPWQ